MISICKTREKYYKYYGKLELKTIGGGKNSLRIEKDYVPILVRAEQLKEYLASKGYETSLLNSKIVQKKNKLTEPIVIVAKRNGVENRFQIEQEKPYNPDETNDTQIIDISSAKRNNPLGEYYYFLENVKEKYICEPKFKLQMDILNLPVDIKLPKRGNLKFIADLLYATLIKKLPEEAKELLTRLEHSRNKDLVPELITKVYNQRNFNQAHDGAYGVEFYTDKYVQIKQRKEFFKKVVPKKYESLIDKL